MCRSSRISLNLPYFQNLAQPLYKMTAMNEKRTYTTQSPQQRGFTILELITVITIIAVIGVIAVPTYLKLNQDARMTKAVTDINTMGSAVVQKFHELSSMASDWPTLANAKSQTPITNGTILFMAKTGYSNIYWSDLFGGRQVPICPIDGQPYNINVINTGSVDYISTGGGTMMAAVVDPEFEIFWVSNDTPPDTVSARFRP